MATVIQIKSSSTANAPLVTDLVEAELAYAEDRAGNGANAVLYIESINSDNTTAAIHKIGGKYYTDKVDARLIDAAATTAAKVTLAEATNNGTNKVTIAAPAALTADYTLTLPADDGGANEFLKTDGSGNLSWGAVVSSLTLAGDTGTDTFNTGETLTFTGGTGIASTITNNTVTFDIDSTVATLTGTQTLTNKTIAAANNTISGLTNSNLSGSAGITNANLANSSISINGTAVSLGGSITGLATTAGNLSQFAATTSAQLLGVISDETGSGVLVFGTSPTFTTSIDGGATFAAFASSTSLTVGYNGTATSTTNISTGATATGTTKTINLGTGGAAGSTTNVNIGSSNGGTTTVNKDLVVSGNLTVNGTTTTVNSTTITVDDKNIELGSVATPTDTTADGGGITLKGATDKTFNWVSSTTSWTSSENLELASGKAFRINGSSVLSATALGTGVTGSSLTSVGTISTGVWQGTAVAVGYGGTGASTFTANGILYGNGTGALQATAAGTNGYFLYSNNGTPAWTNTISGGTY